MLFILFSTPQKRNFEWGVHSKLKQTHIWCPNFHLLIAPPPHLFCDLCFSLESITGSTQHPWPPCRMKVTNAPTNSARSFYSLSSFHPCERWLVNSCTRNLTAPIGSVILLAHTITLVLFDWTLGIFQISSLTPKYIYVGCHYFAFSNDFHFPLTRSLLTIDQAHENL
jgi:hypothetical protein